MGDKPAVVRVSGIAPAYLFMMMSTVVREACGDGCAVICCGNPKETGENFVRWLKHEARGKDYWSGHQWDDYPSKEEDAHIWNFHDSNENFMFADKYIDISYGDGDISFIVEGDLVGFNGHWDGGITVKGLQ